VPLTSLSNQTKPNYQQSVSIAVPFTNLKPIPNQQLVLSFAVPFTSLSSTCKNAGPEPFR
jgi:hypothetical protein